jgi:hypothetical protein
MSKNFEIKSQSGGVFFMNMHIHRVAWHLPYCHHETCTARRHWVISNLVLPYHQCLLYINIPTLNTGVNTNCEIAHCRQSITKFCDILVQVEMKWSWHWVFLQSNKIGELGKWSEKWTTDLPLDNLSFCNPAISPPPHTFLNFTRWRFDCINAANWPAWCVSGFHGMWEQCLTIHHIYEKDPLSHTLYSWGPFGFGIWIW